MFETLSGILSSNIIIIRMQDDLYEYIDECGYFFPGCLCLNPTAVTV